MTSGDARDEAPGSEPTDAELLRAHVDGDQHAFGELVRRHRDRLWAVALRTIGDREEAADAVQDALLSAHRGAARFRGDSAVTTWLHRIVVNACLDRIRRRQAHPTVPLPDGTHTDDGGLGARGEPAAPVQDHDTALVVRAALAALPAEQRAALVLVDVQGYPVVEAAGILGVAEGTIKSRCARGRARMALALGHLRVGFDPVGGSARDAGGPARGAGAQSGAPGDTDHHGERGRADHGGERQRADRGGERGRADGGERGTADHGGAPGDADHGGNRGAAGRVPSGSGATVPLPATGSTPASTYPPVPGDRGEQA
ncbi:RNA polymerase sigma-70 factor (ECF subfamily) [Pseudosporangium ferrugineum]|uniref:RNA polymerase sigma-70 factor (ECF subfamily) n=1 Tax=Pseudosporangium ferrugineum TaxID=439699 RepID=A0A2T0S1A8_9ACTN|nr:RNA polymerase sigma-70 factor (ECF subfamily) [Pseudosporangium ferrugineum]